MDGELEKETCSCNVLSEKEVHSWQVDYQGNSVAAQIRSQVAKAIRTHYANYPFEEINSKKGIEFHKSSDQETNGNFVFES
jgi:hypothetical protein